MDLRMRYSRGERILDDVTRSKFALIEYCETLLLTDRDSIIVFTALL